MNKPNNKWDWAYWISSLLLTLFTLSEVYGCAANLKPHYFGYRFGIWCPSDYGFILVGMLLFVLSVSWIIFTIGMFFRAIFIKKSFAIKKYLFVYILPMLIAVCFGIYLYFLFT